MDNIEVLLTSDRLSVEDCFDAVKTDGSGACNLFIGTVRNLTSDKTVKYLEFEAYEPMAIKEMKKIGNQALEKWPLHKVAIHHRLGKLDIGEIPVIIAVSAQHRDVSFEACQYIIDTLKETVPIWKKEFFEGGEVWVNAHP